MKKLFAAALMIAAGSSAMAQNNVGCGWGSAVFNGQRGVAPQVLADTTNGTSGNATFGMTSGTDMRLDAADLVMLIGLVLLYFEVFKATRTSNASILDHIASLAVFVVALVEFLLLPRFAHGAFLAGFPFIFLSVDIHFAQFIQVCIFTAHIINRTKIICRQFGF